MKIELDEREYNKLKNDNFNAGYREGWTEAGIFVICKRDKNWKDGDLHMVCKSSGTTCPVCEFKNEIKKRGNLFEENKVQITEKISQLFNKYFPTKHPQKYKASALYSDLILYLESFKQKN